MSFFRVSSCCCCCTLQMGTRIIAIIILVVSAIDFAVLVDLTIEKEFGDAVEIYIAFFFADTSGFLISCLLLHGANSCKPVYLLPWLVYLPIFVLALMGLAIYCSMTLSLFNEVYTAIGGFIFCAIVLGIGTYLLLVVLSFYHELKAEQEEVSGHHMNSNPDETNTEKGNNQEAEYNPPEYPDGTPEDFETSIEVDTATTP